MITSTRRRRLCAAALIASGLAATACGGSDVGSPSSSVAADRGSDSSPMSASDAALESSVWAGIRPELETAKEIEFYETVDAAIGASDVIAVGTVGRVEPGRVVQGPPTMGPIQFANFVVSQADGTEVVFEHPIPVSSKDLTEALRAATDPNARIDPETGDPVGAIDADAVAAAYATHWPAAAAASIQRANQSLPKSGTIVLLRKVTVDGSVGLRPLTSSAVIVDDNGAPAVPLAPETHVPASYTESLGASFDELAARATGAAQ
jgi:hypothetical protein